MGLIKTLELILLQVGGNITGLFFVNSHTSHWRLCIFKFKSL